jgi:hypothetical protein
MAARNKKRKGVKLLIFIWVLFIAMISAFGVFLYKNRDQFSKDVGITEEETYIYTVNSNPEINTLITIYLKALASADQASLKNCVTTPSQYDNMTTVDGRSKVITDYGNINCYFVEGPEPESYIVYTIMNITISGVESKPLDIYKPFYVVKVDGKYKIDNSAQSQELQDFINKVSLEPDIQQLYQMVKADQDSKAASDPTFAEFMNKLDN